MSFPKKLAVFTAQFENVGQSNETLRISWNWPNPPANPGSQAYLVGTEVFLETITGIAQVPDEHLIASLGMCAILGAATPGSKEFIDGISNQDTTNFQTIVGNAKLKTSTLADPNPLAVVDANYGPLGTVFDFIFQKVGSTASKTVRADGWSASQYSNRVDNPALSAPCMVGALHKQFGFKKSDLGVVNSANRQSVVDFVASWALWV